MSCAKFPNACIYQIKYEDKVYIGSCVDLEKRIRVHRSQFKAFLQNKMKYVSSFDILSNENYHYNVLCLYPCDNLKDLKIKEQEYLDITTNYVNRNKAYLSREAYNKYHRDYNKNKKLIS